MPGQAVEQLRAWADDDAVRCCFNVNQRPYISIGVLEPGRLGFLLELCLELPVRAQAARVADEIPDFHEAEVEQRADGQAHAGLQGARRQLLLEGHLVGAFRPVEEGLRAADLRALGDVPGGGIFDGREAAPEAQVAQ